MNKALQIEGAPRRLRSVLAALAFAALPAFAPLTAFAWNDTGHVVAALIAYDDLSDGSREWAVRTLRAHPRFEEDFAARLPRSLQTATAAEQDRWYFAAAATWPDDARRFDDEADPTARAALVARYSHPGWHYVNLPVYLQPSDQRDHPIPDPPLTWHPGLEPSKLNIVQALTMAFETRCAAGQSAADRAVAMSWFLHLTADLHQPLHASALYGVPLFERGDRGGNDVPVLGAGNLHRLWDDALGGEQRWGRLVALARKTARQSHDTEGAFPGDAPGEFVRWARDSRELADRAVYSPDVRGALIAAGAGPVQPLEIGSAYRQVMHEIGARQVALAGRRIAALVERLYTDAVQASCGAR